MKIQQKQIAVIIIVLYIKSCHGKGRCQHYWDPKVNKYTSCILFDEQGYEGIHGKENGTDHTVGKYLPDITSSLGKGSVVERMNKCNEHKEDFSLSAFIDGSRCMTYFETSGLTNIVEKLNASVQEKQRKIRYLYSCSSSYVYFGGREFHGTRAQIIYNISLSEETGLRGSSLSHESDVTTSAPTKSHIVDTSQSSGKNSYIEWTQVIHTGSIIIFLVIITAVSVTCVKCYVDRRLRTLNRATERNEHEPLHNHNGATYIPMEDLNVNRSLVAGELQESDQENRNGNVNSSPESPEGQCESETEGMTGSQSNDSFHAAGPFCRCCGLHWTRCKKRNKEQRIAPVQPQQGVNEIPSTETVEFEVLVDGYSNFSSSIFHHPESHGSTSTVDEETTHVKSVYSNEQVSSTVEQTNEAEGTFFEESQQDDLHNEDHMTTGN